ncbi:MAG: galactokinase [Bacteroidota bacterium]
MNLKDKVNYEFKKRFKQEPVFFTAPGRINLIGEHTDYNEGFVMPAAIDKHVSFAVAPNGSGRCTFFAIDYNEEISFSLDELKPGDGWVNYLMGVMHGLRQIGFPLQGVNCVFGSTIPVGAGLSSSAALCCGFGFALSELFDWQLARLAIAKVAQYSEHHFAGVMCGIMDQYASLFGVTNSALLLDCRELTHEVLPVNFGEYRLLLVDTKVKHSLASTAYNDRRASCEEGVRLLSKYRPGIKSLRDVNRADLYEHQDELGEEVFIKCLFVVEEIARTQEAAKLLKAGDLQAFGARMYETHWGLSQAYEVSCEELDFLVSLAEEDTTAVIGSRMMGGGFGGCTINFVQKDKFDHFRGYVHEKYVDAFGKEPEFYALSLSEGVHRD